MYFTNYDALYGLILFILALGAISNYLILKRSLLLSLITIALVMGAMMLEIMLREEFLAALRNDFYAGEELICKDADYRPLRISHDRWEIREERLAFKGERGIDLLDNECTSLHAQSTITFAQKLLYAIATLLELVAFVMVFQSMRKKGSKEEKNE